MKQPHAQLLKLAVICRKREAHIDTNTKQKNRSKSMSKVIKKGCVLIRDNGGSSATSYLIK